jgi:hypothetical protein
MDAHDETPPEAPKRKPKAPKPEIETAPDLPETPAPRLKPAGVSIKAIRRMHIDPADIVGFHGQEAVSIRLQPGETLHNLKTHKAEALIARGFASAV